MKNKVLIVIISAIVISLGIQLKAAAPRLTYLESPVKLSVDYRINENGTLKIRARNGLSEWSYTDSRYYANSYSATGTAVFKNVIPGEDFQVQAMIVAGNRYTTWVNLTEDYYFVINNPGFKFNLEYDLPWAVSNAPG